MQHIIIEKLAMNKYLFFLKIPPSSMIRFCTKGPKVGKNENIILADVCIKCEVPYNYKLLYLLYTSAVITDFGLNTVYHVMPLCMSYNVCQFTMTMSHVAPLSKEKCYVCHFYGV